MTLTLAFAIGFMSGALFGAGVTMWRVAVEMRRIRAALKSDFI